MRLACLLLMLTLGLGIPAEAQDPPASGGGVRASIDGGLGLQRLSDGALGTVSARLWLHLGEQWRVGFGGARGLNRTGGGALETSGLEAGFGMATLTAARRVPTVPALEAAFTLGSGAVSLDNTLLGTTLDTETVWVLEPALSWMGLELGPTRAGAEIGYRWMLGWEGLSRLDSNDLDTFVLRLVVSLDRL